MNSDKLSLRLEAVTQYIPKGNTVADIGSDHAYLPCYTVKKGITPSAIAGEVVQGPFQSAQKQVQSEGLQGVVDVRFGDGLAVLTPGEVDCITIAGMGGTLITKILEDGYTKLDGVKRLILQPNIHASAIREWLLQHEWKLVNESILEEDGKIYEILVAEPGEALTSYEQDSLQAALLMGPYLMKERNAIFQKKWQFEVDNWHRILAALDKAATNVENEEKTRELQKKIKMVEEVIKK